MEKMPVVCMKCRKETREFGINDLQETVCYECCATEDMRHMRERGIMVLYLGKNKEDKWEITNWPGTLKFTPQSVERKKTHVFDKRMMDRYDAWFTFEGNWWHLIVLGDMQCGTARKLTDRKAIARARNRWHQSVA